MSKQAQVATDDSVTKLLGLDLGLQDRASILLGLDSGLRLGEIVELNVNSLKSQQQSAESETNQIYTSVVVTGLYTDRDVAISERTSSVLAKYLINRNGLEDSPLFQTPTGRRFSKQAFQRRFNAVCHKYGLTNIRFHSLRRVFVGRLAASHTDSSSRKNLRNYSRRSRAKYVHVLDGRVRLEYLEAMLRISRRIAMESNGPVLKGSALIAS